MAIPAIVFEAADDTVVRNDYIQEMYKLASKKANTERQQKSKVPNKFITLPRIDHTLVCYEKSSV